MKESIKSFDELSRCVKYFRECGNALDFSDACYIEGKKIKDMSIEELEALLLDLKGK